MWRGWRYFSQLSLVVFFAVGAVYGMEPVTVRALLLGTDNFEFDVSYKVPGSDTPRLFHITPDRVLLVALIPLSGKRCNRDGFTLSLQGTGDEERVGDMMLRPHPRIPSHADKDMDAEIINMRQLIEGTKVLFRKLRRSQPRRVSGVVRFIEVLYRDKLWDAVKQRDIKKIRKLFGRGLSSTTKDDEGSTVLHHAILSAGSTPCAMQADYCLISYLLRYGGDVNASASRGITPLHCAAAVNRFDLAALLIKNGAEVDAWSDDRHTPLHYAANECATGVARKLLAAGARPDLIDDDHYTPRDYAMFAGADDELVQLLSV